MATVGSPGLDWKSQHVKLTAQRTRFNCGDITTVGADGKQREMLCMPFRRYPYWFATINLAKIPDPNRRARVVLFQEFSIEALFQITTAGIATTESVRDALLPDEIFLRVEGQTRQQTRELTSALEDTKGGLLGFLKRNVVGQLTSMQSYIEARLGAMFERDKRGAELGVADGQVHRPTRALQLL